MQEEGKGENFKKGEEGSGEETPSKAAGGKKRRNKSVYSET